MRRRIFASDGKRLVGFASKQTLASSDGATWTKLGDAPPLEYAVWAEDRWFGGSVDGFFTSPDATTWTPVLKTAPQYVGSIGFGRVLE